MMHRTLRQLLCVRVRVRCVRVRVRHRISCRVVYLMLSEPAGFVRHLTAPSGTGEERESVLRSALIAATAVPLGSC
jgi:hypothetical protein